MKRFKWFLAVLIAFAFLTTPAMAAYKDMWANVYRWKGATNSDGSMVLERITSGVQFQVLAKGTITAETLYVIKDKSLTSLTNAVTSDKYNSAEYCNDRVAFRVDPTDSTDDRYVDLIVHDMSGPYSVHVKNFDEYQHNIIIDERLGVPHKGTIWFDNGATAAANTGTGVLFPAYTSVTAVLVESGGGTANTAIDVGIPGTATGFVNKETLATTGIVNTSSTSTGSLLKQTGAYYVPYLAGYLTTAAQTLIYTLKTTTGVTDGLIHYFFTVLK